MVGAAENASFGEREDGVRGRFNYTWAKALWEQGKIYFYSWP